MGVEFDRDYRRRCVRKLEKSVLAHASLLADGIESWEQAQDKVLGLAFAMGAGWLSDAVLMDLVDGVQLQLAHCADLDIGP